MIIAQATLVGVSPLSFSRAHSEPKLTDNEHPDAYDTRTWRSRLHADQSGRCFIPPMTLKYAITATARFRSVKIPGQRNATYTKHFEAGVLVVEGAMLYDAAGKPIMRDEVEGERLYLNADGKRGGSTRVWRTMPKIHEGWNARASFYVLDEVINADIFQRFLVDAGKFNGLGRFRPQMGGFYGRFVVKDFAWSEEEVAQAAE